jgi:hypothetical protein
MTRNTHPLYRARRVLASAMIGGSLLLLSPLHVYAHEGHDHGGGTAAPLPTLTAGSKFVAVSEDFEVVGTLGPDAMILYLDEARTNTPVDDATLEVVADGAANLSGKAVRESPGTYRLAVRSPVPPGTYGLTLGIETSQSSDLLTAKLVVERPSGIAPVKETAGRFKPLHIAYGLAAIAVIALVAIVARRRRNLHIGNSK